MQNGSTLTKSEIGSSLNYENNSLIVINQTEYTWYGDFIVNAGDTVVIENCNFTVVNGEINVYGTMEVGNSTIWMRHTLRKTKTVYAYGNFTMFHSQILNENRINCYDNSHVFVLNSSSPTTRCTTYPGSDIEVHNSVLCAISSNGGKIFLLNATLLSPYGTILRFMTSESFVALDSHILSLWLLLCYEGDLEIRPGLVENLTIYSQSQSANFTLVNSYVTAWNILCLDFSGKFSNSIINTLRLEIDPEWSGNLTLTPGYVEYQEMAYTKTPIIVENSTVNKWEIENYAPCMQAFQIINSEIALVLISSHLEISIKNSEVQHLAIDDSFGISGGSLLTVNSTISSAEILLPTGISLDLSLKEGFNDFFNLYIPEYGSNMTIVKSTVDNWNICVLADSSLVLSNSTLTEGLYPNNLENLDVLGGSCLVYNSSLACVYCWANLTLVNSTVNTLYAYGDSTVTAVNSTINMLITDPIQVELMSSTIPIELDFSFEMTSEDAITSSSSEEYDPLLPEVIQRFSQYINITTRYNDYFEAQVRIYYNEIKVEEAGIYESRLRMYCLDKLGIWQLSPIQGVNTIENYVWANVTHFSCFVVAFIHAWIVDDDGPADFHTIQEAINAASDGDTIFVKNGIYHENVVINKTISLNGEGRDATIIDGSMVGNVVKVSADNVKIMGFTIQNSGQDYNSAVYVSGSSTTITNNTVVHNAWYGIMLENSQGNNISKNVVMNTWAGIYLHQSSNTIISENTLFLNGEPFGIALDGANNNYVGENSLEDCLYESIELFDSDNNIVTSNYIARAHMGIWISYAGNNTISRNNIEDSGGLVTPVAAIGFGVGCSNNTLDQNSIKDNEMGIIAYSPEDNNRIYHNNFINNTVQVYHSISGANWDNGYPSGGNYWSDYIGADLFNGPNQNETGSDGIGDIPYVIDENNVDHYPLMEPWTPTPIVAATIGMYPYALSVWSRSKEIATYIELPEDYNVNDIHISTIMLNKTIPVDLAALSQIGDYNGDGFPDLMVKFNRARVISYILANVDITQLFEQRFMTITLTIIGKLNDGTLFSGSDTIKIIVPMPRYKLL
jgi:parallel beta-helix repeat protein